MSFDISHRFRRLRQTPSLRRMVRGQKISVDDLVYPIFVEENIGEKVEISSMPGVFRYPETQLAEVVKKAELLGIPAILLFGVSHNKDEEGSDTWNKDGLLARMIKIAKQAAPNMTIIADVCFCEYTSHGHCGVIEADNVCNDVTLENLQKQVLNATKAGADIIAPSGMMDGQIMAVREGLDSAGFGNTPIMSYSTKFASAFYGPFRDAVDSSFKGDRKSYQMDFCNKYEALAESIQDEMEGADILMVKPSTCYLDVVSDIRKNSYLPLAVYHVSGEYAMIKFAANAGAIDEKKVVMETMLAFKRAGVDIILTYYALDIAKWLNENY